MTAPGTDIKLGIAGRKFIPCVGDNNMPDGEFFTGPVEDSVEGEVSFHLPAVIGGREVAGVRLRFEAGRVVDACAERGEEYLLKLLDTDEGARTLGELGIGTNYGIDKGTREVLLDEKIGGTVHMAVGSSYPESGGENESAVHTDLVCDLRLGGKLEVDGVVMQEDGSSSSELSDDGDQGSDRPQESDEHRPDHRQERLIRMVRFSAPSSLRIPVISLRTSANFLPHLGSHFPEAVIDPLVEVVETLVGPRFPCHHGHDGTLEKNMQRVVRET